jgi:hypothetical protein
VLVGEVLILAFAYKAYLPSPAARRAGRPGNTIARLVMDEPGFLASMAFYVVLFHVLIAFLWWLAWWWTRRSRGRAEGRPDGPRE